MKISGGKIWEFSSLSLLMYFFDSRIHIVRPVIKSKHCGDVKLEFEVGQRESQASQVGGKSLQLTWQVSEWKEDVEHDEKLQCNDTIWWMWEGKMYSSHTKQTKWNKKSN